MISDSRSINSGERSCPMIDFALGKDETSFTISGSVTLMLRISKAMKSTIDRIFPREDNNGFNLPMSHQPFPDPGAEEVHDDHNHGNRHKCRSHSPEVLQDDPLPQEETDSAATYKTDNSG